jgi:hypothetical protein
MRAASLDPETALPQGHDGLECAAIMRRVMRSDLRGAEKLQAIAPVVSQEAEETESVADL